MIGEYSTAACIPSNSLLRRFPPLLVREAYSCCVGKSFNLEDNYYFEIIITPSLPYNYIEVVPLTLHHSEHETNLKSHSAKNSLLFFSLVHGVIVALGDLTLTSSTFQLSSWYDP